MMQYEKWLKKHTKRLDGKLAVLTGANSGIGFEAARYLLSLGASLILACRSEERGEAARERLLAEYPNGTAELCLLDLACFASIDAFAMKMRERGAKIDIFLHFAGLFCPKEATTADGIPTTVGVNYTGTVRLAEAVQPMMANNGRMIFTTSIADRFGKVRKDPLVPHEKEAFPAYAESKLLLSAYIYKKAAERGENSPIFIATHPGVTATPLFDPNKTTHSPRFSRLALRGLSLLTHPKEKAALNAVFAAAGDARNGDCIGPRGLFGISGYPHRTRLCRKAKKAARVI